MEKKENKLSLEKCFWCLEKCMQYEEIRFFVALKLLSEAKKIIGERK